MSTRLLAILLGFVLDLLVGDPNWFPHPVRLVGLFISTLERAIRRVCKTKKALRIGAIVLTTLTISATMGATALVLHLLALLGLRRPTSGTIYSTPLGQVIGRLVTIFKPHGFQLTAPVFEHLSQGSWLDAEVAQDMAHGMIAKTAIHPDQVPQIERHYQVAQSDIELALRIMTRIARPCSACRNRCAKWRPTPAGPSAS